MVTLKVGDKVFLEHESIFEDLPATSPLAVLLKERPKGRTFVFDREGDVYESIIGFLRKPTDFRDPEAIEDRIRLYDEASFLKLQPLLDALTAKYEGAELPGNDEERVQCMDSLDVLFSDYHDRRFDCITQLVVNVLGVPAAMINLVHKDKQHTAFSTSSLQNAIFRRPERKFSFCSFLLTKQEFHNARILIVPNTREDTRFDHHPSVLGEPHLIFYAGCPIVTSSGYRLGALCCVDVQVHTLDISEQRFLANMAQLVALEYEREDLAKRPPSDPLPGTRREVRSDSALTHGPLRRIRMQDALHEAVSAVQLCESGGWRLLYTNFVWSDVTESGLLPHKPDSPIQEPVFLLSCVRPEHETLDEIYARAMRAWDMDPDASLQFSAKLVTRRRMYQDLAVECRLAPARAVLDAGAAAVPAVSVDAPSSRENRILGAHGQTVCFLVMTCRPPPPAPPAEVPQVLPAPERDRSTYAIPPLPPSLEGVKFVRELGGGMFGRRFYCLNNGLPIAAKVLDWESGVEAQGVFTQTAKRIQETVHKNLARILQVFVLGPDTGAPSQQTWILQEWCEQRSLAKLLRRRRPDLLEQAVAVTVHKEVAEGMAVLHSLEILHGSLATDTVLLKSSGDAKGFTCKLSDYGMGSFLMHRSNMPYGNVLCMPKEIMDNTCTTLTKQVDVYSAGIIMWETATGTHPYSGVMITRALMRIKRHGCPPLPEDTQCIYRVLVDLCTRAAEERPAFTAVVEHLKAYETATGALDLALADPQ